MCAVSFSIVFITSFFFTVAGSAWMHSGTKGFDEGGAGGHPIGDAAARRWGGAGQDEEGRVPLSTV